MGANRKRLFALSLRAPAILFISFVEVTRAFLDRNSWHTRAAEFSWERCARETMRIFAETSASHGQKHSRLPLS
jgi:hypothetical protein